MGFGRERVLKRWNSKSRRSLKRSFSRKQKVMMTVLGERNQDVRTKNLFMGPTSNLNFKKNLLAQLTPLTWFPSALKISCVLNDQITLSSGELQCDF